MHDGTRAGRELRAECDVAAARARKLAQVIGLLEPCWQCGNEADDDGPCTTCEVVERVKVEQHEEMRKTAPERRANGTYCRCCDGEGWVSSFGAVGNIDTCKACFGSGVRESDRETLPLVAVDAEAAE